MEVHFDRGTMRTEEKRGCKKFMETNLNRFLTLPRFLNLNYRRPLTTMIMKRFISIMAMMLLASGIMYADEIWRDETLRYGMYLGPIKAE